MSLLDALRHRLDVLLHGGRHARELEEELDFHLSLDAMQREHAARGVLSHDDARAAARRRFGNRTSISEETRRMAGLGFLDVARQDLRFALRTFRRAPGFTLVAVLTLAIGIGGNTAIFSAVDAMLLRPLPFRDPERLMQVSLVMPGHQDRPGTDGMIWSYPKFVVLRDAQTVFEDLTLYGETRVTLRGAGDAERVEGEETDSRYLTTLGIQPVLGRNFAADEDRAPSGPRVVMIGNALWSRRFNADPGVIGRVLDVDGAPTTIVGVLPPGFAGVSGQAEVWVPIMTNSAEYLQQAWNHSYTLIARRKPGVSAAQATAMVRQIGARIDRAYPDPEIASMHWGATARPLDAARVDPKIRLALLVLLGAVGLVLLIACANVANLFLLRASGRRREIAVRLAIGAGRRRLVRQLLTESVLLAAIGGAAGLLLAWWGAKALAAIDPTNALRLDRRVGLGAVQFSSIHLDARALLFAALVAIGTGIIFGLVPALQATKPSLTDALKEDGAATPAPRVRGVSTRAVFAAVEIALAVVLLAGSGLMLRSLGNLLGVNPGFDGDRVLTLRLNARESLGRDSLPVFYDEVLDRLAGIPGVQGIGLTDCQPLNGGCNRTGAVRRDRPSPAPGMQPLVGVHWVSPDWHRVLRVPLLRGRFFSRADRVGTRKVVLVNATAARRLWPGEDPIGKPVSVGQGGFSDDTAYVVGVVGDVRYGTLDSLPLPDVYLSYYQSPRAGMMLFVRTAGDPLALAPLVRARLHELAPDVPLYDVRTLDARVGDAMAYARFTAMLLALFGAVALALATLGTYGVISYAVAQRTREIGVRMALGASRGDVVRMVVVQGLAIAVAGGAAGLAVALGATRVMRNMLYEVTPSDPATYVAIVAVLGLAVVLACWIPARRAASIQPAEALRG